MFKNLSRVIYLISFACFFFLISIFLVSGLTWSTDYTTVNVNSSNYWDDLDTPADIPNSEFWYNHTSATYTLWNGVWGYNHSLNVLTRWGADFNSTFNSTYDTYAYNHTLDTFTLWNTLWTKWITNNPWLYNDTDTIYFNESKLTTIYYNATNLNANRGTTAGILKDIQIYDRTSYNVTEEAGANGLDFKINFTGVSDFNHLVIRYKSTLGETHLLNVQIYDYSDANWENYATISEAIDFNVIELGVYDADEHINGGVVSVRFYQSANGNTNHEHYFDWVTIADGFATPSGAETDPFSFHKEENLNNTDYNITAENFYKEENKAGFCTNATHWFMGNITYAYEQGWCG